MTTAFPLQWPRGWPRTAQHKRRTTSPFKTSFERARKDLYGQLELMGASGVVVSSNIPLRIDGTPRADIARAKIDDPGVAVYFTWREKQMVMARDAFSNVFDNLRSIGLAVEFMRGLERHGGATIMERAFSGFSALPPPASTTPACFQTLGLPADASIEEINSAFREKARGAHPDNGGSHEAMSALSHARDQAIKIRMAA